MLTSISTSVRRELLRELDRLAAVASTAGDFDPLVAREDRFESLGEEEVVVRDEDADRLCLLCLRGALSNPRCYGRNVEEDVREQIQKLLVTGDNRLKQGVDPAKVRESWEQALALAREAGLEERIRPLVELQARRSRPAARLRIASIRSAWRRTSCAADASRAASFGHGSAAAVARARASSSMSSGSTRTPASGARTPAGHRCASRRRSGRTPSPRAAPGRAARRGSAAQGRGWLRGGAGSRRGRRGRGARRSARPSSAASFRAVAGERQRPSPGAGEGVGESDDVLPLGERADAEEARRTSGAGWTEKRSRSTPLETTSIFPAASGSFVSSSRRR